MTAFLLDTNVASELARPRPSPQIVAFIRQVSLEALFLSDVVIAEIRYGIENATNTARREALLVWLKQRVRPAFAGRILPVTEDILVRCRWMLEVGRRAGYTFQQSDVLLAATAAHHGLTVVTRDVGPFEQAGVAVIDPWQQQ